jgi:membrane associated rhomboid family serine protease
MGVIILLAVLGFVAYRMTTAAQRARYLAYALDVVRELKASATQPRPEADTFRDLLRARTPLLVITPAIAAINVALVASMLFGVTAFNDPDTLVGWGASLGPRTTNGEWWRLATSPFVHIGLTHLLVNVAILSQLGAVLERLVGRLAFAAVYISAGAFATLISLSSYPVSVSVGASGAVFGLYGLLIASLIWQTFQQRRADQDPGPAPTLDQDPDQAPALDSEPGAEPIEPIAGTRVAMPPVVIKQLGCGFALFLVCSAVNGFAGTAEAGALIVGLGYGLVLGRSFVDRHPRTGHAAATIAAAAVVAVACALPLRNIADVKPEIARAITTEERTSTAYRSALEAFKKGHMTAEALAELTERTIVPALQAVDGRLETLRNVPPEYRPLVADAREYLRLRCESWRFRADAIRRTDAAPHRAPGTADAVWRLQAEARFRSNLIAKGNAEGAERASLDAFQRIKR